MPHSEIHGSKLIRSSPWLIAAYHVLHRLCMPRHSPDALKTLDRSHRQCSSFSWALTPAGYRTGCLRAARATRPDGRSALRSLRFVRRPIRHRRGSNRSPSKKEESVMRRERRTLSLHSLLDDANTGPRATGVGVLQHRPASLDPRRDRS